MMKSLLGHGEFDLHARVDLDRGYLLHVLVRAHKVDDPLVDSEFQALVGVGSFTARRFAHRDFQVLHGHPHRTRHLHVRVRFRSAHDLRTDLLYNIYHSRRSSNYGKSGLFSLYSSKLPPLL